MQLVLNILLVFILINAVLKFSFWKLWQVVAAAVLSVVFLFWAYPYAMEQSQVTIQNALETPSILSNIAVLVTIEVALCLTFCFSELKGLFFAEKNRWNTFLKACPALLMFPVLFYLLTQSFFYFSGMDFFTITCCFRQVLHFSSSVERGASKHFSLKEISVSRYICLPACSSVFWD